MLSYKCNWGTEAKHWIWYRRHISEGKCPNWLKKKNQFTDPRNSANPRKNNLKKEEKKHNYAPPSHTAEN